jgi:putative protease
MNGVCSPASAVRYERGDGETISRLGRFAINAFADGEPAGYPTLCKGRFAARGKLGYLFEEPTSLNAAGALAELQAAGVCAIKIEGRQRGRAYVAQVVAAFRRAIDAVAAGRPADTAALRSLSEGGNETTGAYRRGWR